MRGRRNLGLLGKSFYRREGTLLIFLVTLSHRSFSKGGESRSGGPTLLLDQPNAGPFVVRPRWRRLPQNEQMREEGACW